MKLKKIICASLLTMSFATPTFAHDNEGWDVLFDGSDLSHWRSYQKENVNDGWSIIDGALVLVKKGSGDLITKQEYDSFELSLEWKISAGGNSGFFFHVVERDDLSQTYLSGPEYQLLDNLGRDEPPLEQAGSLFVLYPPSDDYTKPVGSFNHSRLIVKGDYVEHWLNGHKVVSYTMGSDDFKAKVKASKFGKWPTFAAKRKGHIALQDHGDKVSFKNIKIKKLSAK